MFSEHVPNLICFTKSRRLRYKNWRIETFYSSFYETQWFINQAIKIQHRSLSLSHEKKISFLRYILRTKQWEQQSSKEIINRVGGCSVAQYHRNDSSKGAREKFNEKNQRRLAKWYVDLDSS